MQQQKPLEGAQLVIMTIALSLATFMQVLDSTIANVAIPTIAGNLGSSLSQGNVGNHFFRGGECHLDPAYRLAGKARRGSETVPLVHHRLCYCVVGVWCLQQPEYADLLPRDSGDCRRAVDPAFAKSIAE